MTAPSTLTALEDVAVLPVEFRRYADPLTWAWSEDDETVGLRCSCCEQSIEADYFDGDHPLNGDNCQHCGNADTERVILGWTPRVWDRPVVRP